MNKILIKKIQRDLEAIDNLGKYRGKDDYSFPGEYCKQAVWGLKYKQDIKILVLLKRTEVHNLVVALLENGWTKNQISSAIFYIQVGSDFTPFFTRKFDISLNKIGDANTFLEEKILMDFDVILGNPPYNEATTSKHASSKKKGSANLSIQFIEKGLTLLKENGIIAYVTPDHWLRPTSRVRDTLKKDGHFVHADLSSDDIKKEYFPGVGSTFTWWVWAKKSGKNNFICEGKNLPENILECKMFANTGKYDDWQFVLGKKGTCFDWKRTKNNSSVLVPERTVLMPLSSTNKLAIYDGRNMPVNKDFYYYVFDSKVQAQKVVNFFLSEEGKRLVKINKSGPALTKELFINMPIETK